MLFPVCAVGIYAHMHRIHTLVHSKCTFRIISIPLYSDVSTTLNFTPPGGMAGTGQRCLASNIIMSKIDNHS